MDKKYKIASEFIIQLIQPIGGCMATDKITIDGESVNYMYREHPDIETDSGWRFLSGSETQDYADNSGNWGIYDTNTIANYDNAIIPYLGLPIGSELERVEDSNEFRII